MLETCQALGKTDLYSGLDKPESFQTVLSRYGVIEKLHALANDIDPSSLPPSSQDLSILGQARMVDRGLASPAQVCLFLYNTQLQYATNLGAGQSLLLPFFVPGKGMPSKFAGMKWNLGTKEPAKEGPRTSGSVFDYPVISSQQEDHRVKTSGH
ncbi:hypothetical protein JCM16303_005803 [Sporobolomyces ruberrimus]